jgi:cyclic dehypoxanthinyl futalosine synthase
MKVIAKEKAENILEKVLAGHRLSEKEALFLLKEGDLLKLGLAADAIRKRKFGADLATFIIDRNINYTNICISGCKFCAFYRQKEDPEAYLLSEEEIFKKIEEAIELGATQIMLQGGLHPDLDIDFYTNLLRKIKQRYQVDIHSFSPPEIDHIARVSKLSSSQVIRKLKSAGLDSLPGGGAEILVDGVRKRISPQKISAERWLAIMREAHSCGLKSTATMMMGSQESPADRIEHLAKIRVLQDETGGFRAFILWTFQPGNTELGGRKANIFDYLSTLAIARLFLDNIDHIQGSWVTQGKEIGQLTLYFGADDLGSIMLEENVVRAAGVSFKMSKEEMIRLIRNAGRLPAQRNTRYEILRRF